MKLTKCPMCRSNRIDHIDRDFSVRLKKKTLTIPHVKRQKCLACGEEFFDRESNATLDEYRKRPRRRLTAA